MAKALASIKKIEPTYKRTSQGGNRPKTSSMNKDMKRSFKKYRGQGK